MDILRIEFAHISGMQAWNTCDANPYEISGEPVDPELWWAWDMGRRLGEWLDAARVKKFEENLAAQREMARWPFVRRARA